MIVINVNTLKEVIIECWEKGENNYMFLLAILKALHAFIEKLWKYQNLIIIMITQEFPILLVI